MQQLADAGLKIRVSVVRFRDWPPKHSKRRRQPSQVAVFVCASAKFACRSIPCPLFSGAGWRPGAEFATSFSTCTSRPVSRRPASRT